MEIQNGSLENSATLEELLDVTQVAKLQQTLNVMPQSFKEQEYQASAHIVVTLKQDSLKDVMMEIQQMGMDAVLLAQLKLDGNALKILILSQLACAITQMDITQMDQQAAPRHVR